MFKRVIGLLLVIAMGALSPCAFAQQPLDGPESDEPKVEPAESASTLTNTLTGMAKAEYEAARLLFGEGDYSNAIVKFKKAHEVSKDPRLLWNIAVCQKNLRKYSKMLVSIRRYRKEAASVLTDEDRKQADAIVETVKTFISDLKVTSNEAGAEVLVDGEKVGVTPLATRVTVDVGRRKISVRKDGFKEEVRSIEVPGGNQIELKVVLLKDVHRGTLNVVAGDTDAIFIDDKMVGRGSWKGSLASGGHTLRVTAPDMEAFQQEVVIQDGKTRTVNVELNPLAKDATATVLWVVGGVVLAGAVAVTSAFVFSPSEEETVEGSINPGSVQLSSGLTLMSW